MRQGLVMAICISPVPGGAMRLVKEVRAIAGAGLEGDRYASGNGSFNKGKLGKRQVTLINSRFFTNSCYLYQDSRRNIITTGVELMELIGQEFAVGAARMRGVKYCDPCDRPTKLSGNPGSFKDKFFDCGGLIAEVLEGGLIRMEDAVIPPQRDY